MRSVGVEADGTITLVTPAGLTKTLAGSSWTGASTNANAQTVITNFLISNGATGWQVRVNSRVPPNVQILTGPAFTNWWLPEVLK